MDASIRMFAAVSRENAFTDKRSWRTDLGTIIPAETVHTAMVTAYVFLVTEIFWGRKVSKSGRKSIQSSVWSKLWLSFG